MKKLLCGILAACMLLTLAACNNSEPAPETQVPTTEAYIPDTQPFVPEDTQEQWNPEDTLPEDTQPEETQPIETQPAVQLAIKSPLTTVSSLGFYTAAIREDGTAMVKTDQAMIDVSGWTDLISISVGRAHIVGLKSDGTVVAAGSNKNYECEVSEWTDIVAVEAGEGVTVGLKSDGTVVVAGDEYLFGDRGLQHVKDAVAISCGSTNVLLYVRKDGTLGYGVGDSLISSDLYKETKDWTNVIQVASRGAVFAVLFGDGTVKTFSYMFDPDTTEWTDIVQIAVGHSHVVGLKSDGTVVATGGNLAGQCEISDWTDIVMVSAGNDRTIGVKSDGTVVTVGHNRGGENDLSGWENIRIPE